MEDKRDFFVLRWNPLSDPPRDGSYLLLKCLDENGEVSCEYCAYEQGRCFYRYDDRTWGEINEDAILGWAYLPYSD